MFRILQIVIVILLSQGVVGCANLNTSGGAAAPPSQAVNYREIFRILEQRTPLVATRYYGYPHKLGANPDLVRASDCTHLVCAVTRNSLDNTPYRFTPYYMASAGIMENTTAISRDELRAGDMILFKDDSRKSIDHAGIIIAKSKNQIRFVHTSNIKGVMETSTLDTGYRHYWERRFDSFRRWKPQVFSLRSNMLATLPRDQAVD